MIQEISLKPIAFVKNNRTEIKDDNWGEVISEIVLVNGFVEGVLKGIESFSHLQVIYYFHLVNNEKAKAQVRHPRNNKNLPLLGTFAQRNKNRPNKLGLSTCQIIEVKPNSIFVKYLDAINETPILDIKPLMTTFQPQTPVKQPQWVNELMKNYW